MLRIDLCIFIVFLLFCLPGSLFGAHWETGLKKGSFTLFSLAPPPTPAPGGVTPALQAPVILSPLPGQALQGNVPVVARTAVEGFVAFELSFAYFNNPTDIWFLIDQGNQPVMDGALTQWDTSTITDGVYTLRLVVYMDDGSQQTATVPGVRVRNYTPIETGTATPVPLNETLVGILETEGAPSTATPIPSNPAELNQQEVFDGVLKGALAVFGLFILGILYQSIRSFFRNRSLL